MACYGIDIGTYNIIVSRRGENEQVKTKREINCFLDINLENRFTLNLLKENKVKIIEYENIAYIVGKNALDIAYSFPNTKVRRPMKDGCLNPQEKDAFSILKTIIHSLLGEVEKDNDIVYFSVPANAVNEKTNAQFHEDVLKSILKSYNVNGKKIQAYPINEGLAVIFAELKSKNYTGCGISWGGGQINFCYSVLSIPVFKMSLVNSGDWLDENAAIACGESASFINREKTKIDLSKTPTTIVERAIYGHYRMLITNTFREIKQQIIKAGNAVRSETPLDIIIAGGTASPNGFVELVKETIEELKYPIPIGAITKPKDHLYSVAKGALIAAEYSQT
jgi:hypothetical protein